MTDSPLTPEEIKTLDFMLKHDIIDEETFTIYINNPAMAREWLDQEPDETE